MKNHEILTVSVPAELRKQIKELAEKENRNLSNMVTVLLQKGIPKKEQAALSG